MSTELHPLARWIEEFVALRRAQAIEGIEDFIARHPEAAAELRHILPTVELMEGIVPPAPGHNPEAGASTSSLVQLPGELFGDYQIVRELGRGGMGVVFEAIHLPLKRRVALKVLQDRRISNPAELARFQREAGLASKLDHAHICTVFETGEHQGEPFIAMRLLEGETLAALIARSRAQDPQAFLQIPSTSGSDSSDPTPRKIASSNTPRGRLQRGELLALLRLIEKVARALHAAHLKGVIHRDIKPANIMVGVHGDPTVMDFGLARDIESEEQTLTRTGEIFGTPAYMAPEQIIGKRGEVDQQSDIYALGVSLYECLTLRRPFDGSTREALYRQILTQEPTDPRQHAPHLPADLVVVLQAMLEKRRTHRYQSAQAVAEDLRAIMEHRPIAVRPISRLGRIRRWAQRQPAQATLALVLAVGLPALAASMGMVYANLDEVHAAENSRRLEELEGILEEGFLALGEERAQGAIEPFHRALERAPDNPLSLAGLALALVSSGEAEAASELLGSQPELVASSETLQRILAQAQAGSTDLPAPDFSTSEESIDPLSCFMEAARLRRHAGPRDHALYALALELARTAVNAAPRARALYHFQWAMAASDADDELEARRAARAIQSLWPNSPRAWFCIGMALDEFDPERGYAADRRAIELDPALGAAHQSLAHYQLSRGEYGAALESALLAVRDRPADGLFHNTLGTAYFFLQRYPEAVVAFEECLRLRPDYVGAVSNLATVYTTGLNSPDKAELLFRQALEDDPSSSILWLDLAGLYIVQQRWEEAQSAAERACAIEPDNALALGRLGRVSLMRGRFAEAVEMLQRGLAVDFAEHIHRGPENVFHLGRGMSNPEDWVANATSMRSDLALALEQLGRSEEAAVEEEKASAEGESPGFHALATGVFELNRGQLERAEQAFREALQREPDNANAQGQLAGVLVQTGRSEEALALYESALTTLPRHAQMWMNYAVALHFTGAFAEAIAAYEQAGELGMTTAQFFNNYGLSLLQIERTEEAGVAFEEAIARESSHVEAHDNLGLALHRLGRAEESLQAHRRAVELDSSHTNANHNLLERLRELERWPELCAASQAWVERQPQSPEAWLHRTRVLLDPALPAEQRDPLLTVEAAQRHLELGDDQALEAWQLLAQAQYSVGDFEPALETVEFALTISENQPQATALREQILALQEELRAALLR